MTGKIILLNGASSSGKSTLAQGLQAVLNEPFWHFSIDHLLAANTLPRARIECGEFPWRDLRPQFFAGFHHCLPALATAGNNLIVEHIVENEAWMQLCAYSARLICFLWRYTVRYQSLSGEKPSEAIAELARLVPILR